MTMPEISVIIPVFNTGIILKDTIDSVIAQTFSDFEVIIVDDGSTDRITIDVLNCQTDHRIRIIHQVNSGVAAARNRGISESRGKYIAFLDHDDLYLPDKLAVLKSLLDETPNAVLAYSPVIPFGEDISRFIKFGIVDYLTYHQLLQHNLIYSMSCVMVKKKPVERHNIRFDNVCVPCDDWDFYLQLSRFGVCRCTDVPLVKYRMFAGNQSRNLSVMYQAGLNVMQKYRRKTSVFSDISSFWAICRGFCEYHYGYAFFCIRNGKTAESMKHLFLGYINNPFSLKPWRFLVKKLFYR
ncbi:MAG: glycosyltransferase family 2 protein [Lentisphaerae bacterium]|nr:glycosyltransferase family 2 protein [Lentisphaerota bacterium]